MGVPDWGRRKRRSRYLADDVVVSQYGNTERPINGHPFKNRPMSRDTDGGVSMAVGRLTPADLADLVTQIGPGPGDDARATTVGQLREAGFTVTHKPSDGNKLHVLVTLDGHEWSKDYEAAFDGCFTREHEQAGEARAHGADQD